MDYRISSSLDEREDDASYMIEVEMECTVDSERRNEERASKKRECENIRNPNRLRCINRYSRRVKEGTDANKKLLFVKTVRSFQRGDFRVMLDFIDMERSTTPLEEMRMWCD